MNITILRKAGAVLMAAVMTLAYDIPVLAESAAKIEEAQEVSAASASEKAQEETVANEQAEEAEEIVPDSGTDSTVVKETVSKTGNAGSGSSSHTVNSTDDTKFIILLNLVAVSVLAILLTTRRLKDDNARNDIHEE